MAKHQHTYSASGSPYTIIVGRETVTYQRMECACGDAYNAIVSRQRNDN